MVAKTLAGMVENLRERARDERDALAVAYAELLAILPDATEVDRVADQVVHLRSRMEVVVIHAVRYESLQARHASLAATAAEVAEARRLKEGA